jgi:hypothetical protein
MTGTAWSWLFISVAAVLITLIICLLGPKY